MKSSITKDQNSFQSFKWYQKPLTIFITIFVLTLSYWPLALVIGFLLIRSHSKVNNANETMFKNNILNEEALKNKKHELELVNEKIESRHQLFDEYKEQYLIELKEKMETENKELIQKALDDAEEIRSSVSQEVQDILDNTSKYTEENEALQKENEKLKRQITRQTNLLKKTKQEILGINNFTDRFPDAVNLKVLETNIEDIGKIYNKDSLLHNLIELDCHYKNSKELRKEMNRAKRELKKLLDSYLDRYNTKVNKTIYQLMVIGLQAELQNVLYTLSYSKLEEAKKSIGDIIKRYLSVSAVGNQQLLSTITRFLTEIEPLFLEMIEIEYHYYTKRELEKEEQRAIREQMRQDAAERKILKEQQKKLEQEEKKYIAEMDKNKELLLVETDSEKLHALEARIKELEGQFNELEKKKEEVTRLANGKAGYVYVISNLGSFGENMFKIGMTRRLNPQERIDELGSASVPFKFDVHAMIFSNDAVDLEKQLHARLNDNRVNKINLRKEFFNTTVHELQEIVEEIDATVEFKTTLIAQEYHQSMELISVS